MQKNQENLMVGSIRSRYWRTDGAGYIGPAEWQGGSKNAWGEMNIIGLY